MDRNGQPQIPIQSPDRAADCIATETLPSGIEAGVTVTGNRSCGTDDIPDRLTGIGAMAVTATRSNHAEPRTFDHAVYATRSLADRFFFRIKEFQRFVIRCNKWARSFPSPVFLDTSRCLIRRFARAAI